MQDRAEDFPAQLADIADLNDCRGNEGPLVRGFVQHRLLDPVPGGAHPLDMGRDHLACRARDDRADINAQFVGRADLEFGQCPFQHR